MDFHADMNIPNPNMGVAYDDWKTEVIDDDDPAWTAFEAEGIDDDQVASAYWVDSCVVDDTAAIYKYTIASSEPVADAKWTADLFGTYNTNLSYSCGTAGKTTALKSARLQITKNFSRTIDGLNFDHHYVENE